jgi:predicted unusual protein kinase regulating ubiquinone biosynthesis (AarF/ABC1/UbiB family)
VPFLLCPTENIENTIRSFFNYCIDRGICPIDVHQENIIIGYNGKMYIFDVGAFAKLELFPNYASLIGWQLFNLNKHLKKIT